MWKIYVCAGTLVRQLPDLPVPDRLLRPCPSPPFLPLPSPPRSGPLKAGVSPLENFLKPRYHKAVLIRDFFQSRHSIITQTAGRFSCCCTLYRNKYCEICNLKFTKYRFAAGLCPYPLGPELKRSPRPPSRNKGPTSKGRGEKGKGRGKGGEGRRKGKGKGRGTCSKVLGGIDARVSKFCFCRLL